MRLAEVIERFLGKVEIVLAGADDALRQGEDSLAVGDAMAARAAAHRVLAQAPDSPLGLALLADACEAAHLDAELALTLEELARRAPSRAEVWVRLARARTSTGSSVDDVRAALGRALAVAEAGSDARLDALIGLADLDLAAEDGARAEIWLERASPLGALARGPALPLSPGRASDIALRSAEARLLRGDPVGAKAKLEGLVALATDGRAALVRGRTLAALGEGHAFVPLIRAMVLDAPGASEALSSALAYLRSDPQTRTRVRSVVDAKGEQGLARWRAAFARAEGARDAARAALREALGSGERGAARPLLAASIEDRDDGALREALTALPANDADPLALDARRLQEAFPVSAARGADVLDALGAVSHPRLSPWAETLAAELAREWVPPTGEPAAWGPLLARLDARAHAAGRVEIAARVGDLAADRSLPVRLAVLGEFNAGKSTFINALIGADVAPTGVLPTTATLHHLRWAPDPFAKILFASGHDPRERIVALGDLRAALTTLDAESARAVERVELRLPLPSLVSVEILDTPGFNAPDGRHQAVARSAFEEADVAVWLLDATQAMKASERTVLDEARRARLPVQMLVNKADRLSAPDLSRVMDSVASALESMEIGSIGPPMAFSAKKALACRLEGTTESGVAGGGLAAGGLAGGGLAETGWPAVEAFLADRIVGRSAELKERSLRRRAAVLVSDLITVWESQNATDQANHARDGVRARAAADATTRLERDADALAERLADSLSSPATEWRRDLDLVFIGRDPLAAERDSVLARYKVDRAVETIAPALARGLAALIPEVDISPARIAFHARAVVRAAASCAPPDVRDLLGAVSRAAIATLAEQVSLRSLVGPHASVAPGVLRELEALRAALSA